MSSEPTELPLKYCKYHLFGRCKSTLCRHTHDLNAAKVISCRKMNASNADIARILSIIKQHRQIEHINLGRNRVSKKHANELCEILALPTHQIKSLCLDSTRLGRAGFIAIMKAAASSPYLTYLDVSDTHFTPLAHESPKLSAMNSKKKRRSSSSPTAMDTYHRGQTVEAVLHLLSSPVSALQHLIIGHNLLTADECRQIALCAAKRGLTTLDLGGNMVNDSDLQNFHGLLFECRRQIAKQKLHEKKDMPQCIASIILEYTVSENQCLYRCHKWRPR